MPGRPHHTDKWHSCVEKVMGEGHDEQSASAICTTSLQKAGEPIFEGAASGSDEEFKLLEGQQRATMETLHLCGATGLSRTETRDGKEYLVVPVVALMEGVIHPVNAATPEFVPLSTIKRAAASWNGRPVTLGHPTRGGKQCSANDPAIFESHVIGTIFNSRAEGTKLLQEAWIEKTKARKLHPQMLARLEANKTEEVSVGTFVVTSAEPGEFNGKKYKASWLDASGDHLAFLPGGRGACSVEMGCGTHRAAMHFVAAESIELMPERPPIMVFSVLQDQSLDERIQAVNQAVYDKCASCGKAEPMPSDAAYPLQVFDDRVIVRKAGETFSVPYKVDKAGKVTLGDPIKVVQTWVAAATNKIECTMCGGTGQVKEGTKQVDCPACDGTGMVMMKAAAGARHSMSDMQMIQAVHDHAMALGAKCDRSNYKMLESDYATLEARACRQISQAERDAIPAEDFAGPNRSFFIVKPEDVSNAAQSLGRTSGDTDKVKAKIIAIAYRKGPAFVAKLPEAWKRDAAAQQIRYEGGQWVLYSKDGTKKLGEHGSKADAETQRSAIAAIVARRAS